MRVLTSLLSLGLLACCAIQSAKAVFFHNSTGLANPATTVTFDNSGLADNAIVTNQFPGLVFSPHVYKFSANLCTSCTGFANDFVANITTSSTGQVPVVTMMFASPVSAAGMAIVDQGSNWNVEARLGALLVDSGNLTVPFQPGAGFIGFQGVTFDRIVITAPSSSAAIGIDTVQFNPVPEPASIVLAGVALFGCFAQRRRGSLSCRRARTR
jgi:hypothetical protein